MSSEPFKIRAARVEDADAIAHVHHQSWAETYPDMLPAELIARYSLDYRLAQWRRIIRETPPGVARFVAEARDAENNPTVIGVAQCGPARDVDLGASFEIMMIYVLRRAQSLGVGRALMGAMFDCLAPQIAEAKKSGAIEQSCVGLWVLKGNDRAIRFYETMGAALTGPAKSEKRFGIAIEDIAMRWEKTPDDATSSAPTRVSP